MTGAEIRSRAVGRRERPLIRRHWIYDYLPQVPTWFTNDGYFAARHRFKAKLAHAYTWEHLDQCPFCGHPEFQRIANQERHGLPISVDLCMNCAILFNNPRLSNASLEDLYKRDYREIERGVRDDLHEFMFELQGSKGEVIWSRIAAALPADRRDLKIADIGCGEGGLLGYILDHEAGAMGTGYELNLGAGEYARARGLDVRSEIFTGASGKFDVIILEQVLEHMHEPARLIAELAKAQNEGGLLFIGVPGIFAYPGHYQDNLGTYLDYAHMYHFSLYTLERLMAPCGYQLVSGNETVHAVFRRVAGTGTVTTPPATAQEMLTFLARAEADFRARGSHFWNNKGGYKRYLKAMLRYYLGRLSGRTEPGSSKA